MTQAGLYVGGMLGPLGFGALAERVSFSAAWAVAATSIAMAAALYPGRAPTAVPC